MYSIRPQAWMPDSKDCSLSFATLQVLSLTFLLFIIFKTLFRQHESNNQLGYIPAGGQHSKRGDCIHNMQEDANQSDPVAACGSHSPFPSGGNRTKNSFCIKLML